MKTIIENSTKLSKYIFEDNETVIMEQDKIVTSKFIVAILNSNNSTLIESVTPPDDWYGNKYMYDNDVWTLVPNWVDRVIPDSPNTPEYYINKFNQ